MGAIAADSIVSAKVPTLVRLTTLVAAFEFNWTVPKLIVVGAEDRVAFAVEGVAAPVCDDGVPALTPLHAVRRNARAKVNKVVRKAKREEKFLASLFSGEDFISDLRRALGSSVKASKSSF